MSRPPASTELDERVAGMELKEMGGVLLTADIRARARTAGLSIGRLDEAITLAAWAHRDQRRLSRGDLPRTTYIEHPLRNAARVLRWGATDEAIVLACVLHDTVEDHAAGLAELAGPAPTDEGAAREIALAELARRFGDETAGLVHALSNPPSGHPDADEERRHAAYRAHVVAELADPRVAVCKLADLVDNALSLHHTVGDADRTARLARKYAPLLPIVADRVRQADVRRLLSAEGAAALERTLEEGIARLEREAGRA